MHYEKENEEQEADIELKRGRNYFSDLRINEDTFDEEETRGHVDETREEETEGGETPHEDEDMMEDPFADESKCNICQKKFASFYNLKRHKVSKHSKENQTESENKRKNEQEPIESRKKQRKTEDKCNNCGKTFRDNYNLNKHSKACQTK